MKKNQEGGSRVSYNAAVVTRNAAGPPESEGAHRLFRSTGSSSRESSALGSSVGSQGREVRYHSTTLVRGFGGGENPRWSHRSPARSPGFQPGELGSTPSGTTRGRNCPNVEKAMKPDKHGRGSVRTVEPTRRALTGVPSSLDGWRSWLARYPDTVEVEGSTPSPSTNQNGVEQW